MNVYYCDNCSSRLTGEEEFCPKCEIQVNMLKGNDETSDICPVCSSRISIGELKCNYCCSIL